MDPNMTLLVIALLNAITAFLAYKTQQDSKQTRVDVAAVRHETNSMKDALVKASHAAGMQEERVAGEQKAAALAEGVLQGTESKQGKE